MLLSESQLQIIGMLENGSHKNDTIFNDTIDNDTIDNDTIDSEWGNVQKMTNFNRAQDKILIAFIF